MSSESRPPLEGVEAEVAALIATLHETERRLEVLTHGEIDTVSTGSGGPFLLRRAQGERRQNEIAKQAGILDALPARVALLDHQGTIVSVNETWRRFSDGSTTPAPAYGVGLNYAAICDRVVGDDPGQSQKVAAAVRAVLAGTAPNYAFEYSTGLGAARRWFQMSVTPLANAKIGGAVVMHVDITERERAAKAFEALSQQTARRERMLTKLLSSLHDSAYIYDRAGRFLFANEPLLRLWGRAFDEVVGKDHFELGYPPELAGRLQQQVQEVFENGRSITGEMRLTIPGDAERCFEYIFSAAHGPDGTVEFVVGSTRDVTDRRRTATELRTSLAEFRTLAESMPQIVWITTGAGQNVYFSQQWMDYTGLTLEESLGDGWIRPFHPEDREQAQNAWRRATTAAGAYSIEARLRRVDGEYRWWLVRGVPQRDATGTIVKWFGTCTDIHDLKLAGLEIARANRALEQQQYELRQLIDLMPAAISFKGTDNIFRRVNQRFADSVGKSVAEIEGKSSSDVFRDNAAVSDAADLAVTTSGLPEIGLIKSSRDAAGREVWHQVDKVPVYERDGNMVGLVLMTQDITERKRTADELRLSETRFKTLFEQAAVGVSQADATTGRFLQVNQRMCEILGRSREELLQLTFVDVTHPQDLALSQVNVQQMRQGTLREFTTEKRYLRKDGAVVWANATISAMWVVGDKPDYLIAVLQDVTAGKKLEEQFRQSQKMDAIGTLAGGIAHDFNNILAAINGYTELSLMQMGENPQVRDYLGAVLKASGRAIDLVRQILTFSRQQKLERRPIELHSVVAEACKLLRASIPSTIEFEISLKDAPVVLADATQIHQVLMNLGTNAWHAIGDRPGNLQVKLERCLIDSSFASPQTRLNPGEYSRLSVTDSGRGMDEETLKRIFEPFFTTKPAGEGTGLGLAVVHGIMATHDGAVTVYSQPGEGTVFHLYFPAFAGAVSPLLEVGAVRRGNGERVLFVDDEEVLVEMNKRSLTSLGYLVEATTKPAAALALVRADPERFAVVITDQTMPGMTGMDLAQQLLQTRAGLPIIIMTGNGLSLTTERIRAVGIRQLLLKPQTLHTLGTAVHAAIHGVAP